MKVDFQSAIEWIAGLMVALWAWMIVRIFKNEKRIALMEAEIARTAARTKAIETRLEHLTPENFADAVVRRMNED